MDSTRGDIYKFIIDYISENGFPPTIQEIGDGVYLKSKSSIFFHLRTLEDAGLIELPIPGASRAIRVSGYHFVKDSKKGD